MLKRCPKCGSKYLSIGVFDDLHDKLIIRCDEQSCDWWEEYEDRRTRQVEVKKDRRKCGHSQ